MVAQSSNAHTDHDHNCVGDADCTEELSNTRTRHGWSCCIYADLFVLVYFSNFIFLCSLSISTRHSNFRCLFFFCRMHFVYYMSGVWAYPIIDVLTIPLRVVFYLVLLVFATVLYFAGEGLDRLIWGEYSSKSKAKSN